MRAAFLLSSASLAALACIAGVVGCGGAPRPSEVVVYTALDEEFSKPIFDAFTRQTGIVVKAKFDTEATKTVGLARTIVVEADRPRCDVFWNNEVLHTLRLKQRGLLRPQLLSEARNYAPEHRSADADWYGFAARARVILVNTDLVPEARRPRSIEDFTDPQWYDVCGIAKPLFGTTATHAACLFDTWGEERAQRFFGAVKRNARILASNKRVAQQVASGQLKWGLTDTDDAMVEIERNKAPVAIIYPDQPKDADDTSALGTLFIPNTLSMIKNPPNPPEAGQALCEFLLSSLVECRLVIGPSAQIPLSRQSKADQACRCRVKTPEEVKPMEADFAAAAGGWESVSNWLAEEFTSAN